MKASWGPRRLSLKVHLIPFSLTFWNLFSPPLLVWVDRSSPMSKKFLSGHWKSWFGSFSAKPQSCPAFLVHRKLGNTSFKANVSQSSAQRSFETKHCQGWETKPGLYDWYAFQTCLFLNICVLGWNKKGGWWPGRVPPPKQWPTNCSLRWGRQWLGKSYHNINQKKALLVTFGEFGEIFQKHWRVLAHKPERKIAQTGHSCVGPDWQEELPHPLKTSTETKKARKIATTTFTETQKQHNFYRNTRTPQLLQK